MFNLLKEENNMNRFTTTTKNLNKVISNTLFPTIKKTFAISNFTAQEQDIEDIVSQVLEKIWLNQVRYNKEISHDNWFKAIAKNTTLDYIEANKKRENFISLDSYTLYNEDERPISGTYLQIKASETYSSDYNIESKENLNSISSLISSMSPTEKRIIELLLNNYTNQNICDELNLSSGACRTQISRVRNKLKSNSNIEKMCMQFNISSYRQRA